MRLGQNPLHAFFALFVALTVAIGSVTAPVSELSEEMHHAAMHAASGAGHLADAATSDGGASSVKHMHPDTPGHTHCSASCHMQLPDARLVLSVAYAATGAEFIPLVETLRPAAHLDGLFRPPRV